jgi:hypothetical protein
MKSHSQVVVIGGGVVGAIFDTLQAHLGAMGVNHNYAE